MSRTVRLIFLSVALLGGLALPPREAAAQLMSRLPATPNDGASVLSFASQPPPSEMPVYESPPIGSFEQYGPSDEDFFWQILPSDIIYKSYLAGAKESRMGVQIINESEDGALFDATLGGRVGLLRYGTAGGGIRPRGFQVDMEGSAQLRLDIPDDVDLRGVDFRAGLPLTYGWENHTVKFSYYHLSSHAGDEFLLKHPSFTRLNFARDVLVFGYSYYPTENLRLYAEAGWAFYTKVCRPWEFQFGLDYAPARPTGIRGAPFFAINGHLRQEVNFGGNLTVHAGWAWRSDELGRLLRMGLHYYNGESNQFEFFDDFEQQVGFGIWYDF